MIKFGVIAFPGTNCEEESVRAFKRNGMDAEIVLWNDPKMLDKSRLDEFDGYLMAGGFSYEDRGRSGVVAAQDPITDVLKEEADKGKVILGVCNGAQVLVETGLIPGFDNKEVAMGLAWNEMKKGDQIVDTGFYNAWVHLKNVAPKGRSAFSDFDELVFNPIAHGEGRFVIPDDVLEKMKANNQIILKYANTDGEIDPDYPVCPNGSRENIAGICNPAGNVMGMMPHPERDPLGKGKEIFQSMKRWIEAKHALPVPGEVEGSGVEGKEAEGLSIGTYSVADDIRKLGPFDLEILVRLIITDNSERTIEEAINRRGYGVSLSRYLYYGIKLKEGADKKEAAQKILAIGELANLNKEVVYVKLDGAFYGFEKSEGIFEKDPNLTHYLIASDKQDFVGESKKAALNLHAGDIVESVHYGVLWDFKKADETKVSEVISSKILYNPNSMFISLQN